LDTPGHQDFQEDTFRTLTAVDSVIVVIDVAKGVETQTEKLVKVCRMRDTPIIVFINKLDREGKDAFDLIDELEEKLGLLVRPLSWPVGMGQDFQGVYNIYEQKLVLFRPHSKQQDDGVIEIKDLSENTLEQEVGERAANKLREEIEMINEVYPEFEKEDYLEGLLSPVFFGSAINNFGVKELLDCFVKHRDRIAFLRICSGTFLRNTNYLHVRKDKKMKFSNPTSFMAAKKTIVEKAYPGDVVGLYDSGNFKIGDALTEGEKLHLLQLMDEGVAQLFTKEVGNRQIIGTVGALQFDVIQYRLKHEYGASCNFEPVQNGAGEFS